MTYARAFALVMLSALLSSTNGLFVRWMGDIGDWPLVFWRHTVMGVSILLVLSVWYRGRLPAVVRRMGAIGAMGCGFFGTSGVLFVLALHNAPVADVMVMLGAVPPLTALIAWLTLGERVLRSTWAVMAAALVGIAVMVGGNLGGGNLLGLSLAAGNALVVAGFAVVLRWGQAIDMLPMLALGAVLAAVASLPLAQQDLAITTHQVLILLLWGGAMSPLYFSIFVISSRRLPGGELMLALPVEIVAASLLAWAVLAEVPTTATFLGGAAILGAVTALALLRIRR